MSIPFSNEFYSIFSIGISNAIVATILALVVMLVTWRSKWPAWTHALWVLVLVKLLMPPVFWVATGITNPTEPQPTATLTAQASVSPNAFLTANETLTALHAETTSGQSKYSPVDSKSTGIPWFSLLGSVWLLGAVFCLTRFTLQTWKFRRWLKTASPAPADVQQLAEQAADRIRLNRLPKVLVVPHIITPSVFSVGPRACLVLPSQLIDELSDVELSTILTHELVHLRRGDGWVRLLELITGALFWWHPLIPVVCRRIHESAEQACDAWVTSVWPGSTESYASAMIKTIDFLSDGTTQKQTSVPLLTGMGNIHSLAKRIRQISHASTPRALTWRGRFCVIAAALVLLPIGLMMMPKSQAQQPQDADKKATKVVPNSETTGQPDILKIKSNGTAEAAVRNKLLQKTSLQVTDEPFNKVIDSLSKKYNIPIVIDRNAFEEIGISHDQKVSVNIENASLKHVLEVALKEIDATYLIKGNTIHVTTIEAAEANLAARVYQIPASMQNNATKFVEALTNAIQPNFWEFLGGPGTVTAVGDKLVVSATERVHNDIIDFLKQFTTTQAVRVEVNGDEAVVRLSESAPNKLLIAIVTALQKTGTEKFSLKVLAENAKLTVPKTGFVILIRDGEVTLRPSNDTATGTIQQVIEQLQANGYKKFTLRAK